MLLKAHTTYILYTSTGTTHYVASALRWPRAASIQPTSSARKGAAGNRRNMRRVKWGICVTSLLRSSPHLRDCRPSARYMFGSFIFADAPHSSQLPPSVNAIWSLPLPAPT